MRQEAQTIARINELSLDEAALEYQRLLAGEPNCQFAHRELGWVFVRLGNLVDGEFHIRRALELDPYDAKATIFLANVLWNKLECEAAKTAFQTAISLWQDSSVPLWCLAMFYEYQKRPKLAEQFYRRALEIDPNNAVALYQYGRLLRVQHRNAKARRVLERLLSIDPTSERVYAELFEVTLQSQHR